MIILLRRKEKGRKEKKRKGKEENLAKDLDTPKLKIH